MRCPRCAFGSPSRCLTPKLSYRESRFIGYGEDASRNYEVTEYNPPKVLDKEYKAKKYSWYEARKVSTASGRQYEIYQINNVVPGLNRSEDRTDTRVSEGGQILFSKSVALTHLQV